MKHLKFRVLVWNMHFFDKQWYIFIILSFLACPPCTQLLQSKVDKLVALHGELVNKSTTLIELSKLNTNLKTLTKQNEDVKVCVAKEVEKFDPLDKQCNPTKMKLIQLVLAYLIAWISRFE